MVVDADKRKKPMEKRKGDQQTFIVKITNCQNGTWQGKVVWADEEKTKRFRSTLEMLRLMDEAMQVVASRQRKEA